MGSSVIFAGTKVKTLKSTIDLNGGNDIISSTTDPTASAVSANVGSLLLNSSNGKLYRKNDPGSTTNWTEVGASGQAGINYISNPNAATNTTGWATYADAAGAQPVDGTGGSPNVTWTRSTSAPILRGAADFVFAKDAANRQGQGVSTDFTIDNADIAKPLTVTFDYEVVSGTYATGDLTVYLIADPAGTPVVIQPAGYQIQAATASTKMRNIATFQTQASGVTYRLCFHVASTSASAYDLAIDNVVVGPQVVQYGAPVTDWVSYTPTWTASSSNPAIGNGTISGRYRRIGDSIELQYNIKTGTTTTYGSGVYYISIPSGITIDTAKLAESGGNSFPLGYAQTERAGNVYDAAVTVYTSTALYAGKPADGTSSTAWSNTSPATWTASTANQLMGGSAILPVVGWSSTVVMSNDTDTRVVSWSGYTSATTALTGTATAITFTTQQDSTNSWSTNTYTVPVSGRYQLRAKVPMYSATTGNGYLAVYKNNSATNTVDYVATVTNGAVMIATVTYTENLNAGDTIQLRMYNTSGSLQLLGSVVGCYATMAIDRISGPSAIAASETVTASYAISSGASTNDTVQFNFDSKTWDSHGAVTTGAGAWKFTAPISGTYSVAVTMYVGATNANLAMYKNGTIYRNMGSALGGTSGGATAPASTLVQLNAGDYIDVRNNTGSARTPAASTFTGATISNSNFISIVRVGN